MSTLLAWMNDYSPAIVVSLVALAAAVFVLRKTVEKAIDASFERKTKQAELLLGRQSAFKEKVLTERYLLIGGLLARLERIATNLNRQRSNRPVPESFQRGNEIVPLTEVFEDLEIHRLILGDQYYALFLDLARSTLALANVRADDEWSRVGQRRAEVQKQVRQLADTDFQISTISLHERGAVS
jgi:hypothetical protein